MLFQRRQVITMLTRKLIRTQWDPLLLRKRANGLMEMVLDRRRLIIGGILTIISFIQERTINSTIRPLSQPRNLSRGTRVIMSQCGIQMASLHPHR